MVSHSTIGDAVPQSPEGGRPPRRVVGWLSQLFGVALVAAVIAGALRFAEAREFARIAETARPWWFALAVALQVGTYLAAGQVFRSVARAGGQSLDVATACRLGLAKLFIDQALPSAGLSGTLVLASGLERQGLVRSVVAAGVVVDLVSYYVAYALCLTLALAVAFASGEANAVILVVSIVFIAFGIGLSSIVLRLSEGGGKNLPPLLTRLRPLRSLFEFIEHTDTKLTRSPRLLLTTSFFQIAVMLCDAMTVWVLIRSLGFGGPLGGVFASFMISSLVRTVGIIPGGLGTYEAASVLTLRMVGLPTAVALSATLLFRGLSFWIPMFPGIWFSRKAMSNTAEESRSMAREPSTARRRGALRRSR